MTDHRQIGIKAHDEFARRIDPLSSDRGNQSQQYRLVLEQAPETATLHVGDEPIVLRRTAISLRLLRIGRRCAVLPRLGEPLVDCRRGKTTYLLEKQMAQAGASGVVQIGGGAAVDACPKQRLGSFDHRRKQMLERAGLGLVGCRNRIAVLARALQRRLDPDCVVDPRRRGGGGRGANGGEFRQHLADRQSVSIEPSVKQRPIATGRRPAPRRQPPGGQIGIAFLPRQYFEIVGQEFVDSSGPNDQALKKSIHAMSLICGLRTLAADDEVETLHDKNRVMDSRYGRQMNSACLLTAMLAADWLPQQSHMEQSPWTTPAPRPPRSTLLTKHCSRTTCPTKHWKRQRERRGNSPPC